jgi:phosphoribosyl 1,2-cyclic phosphodiesterase
MNIKVIGSSSKGNAYLIDDGATTLLLDAGMPLQKIAEACDFQISKIAGALITHEHQDHSAACSALIKRGVDIYASAGTLGACNLNGHRTHDLKTLEKVSIGTYTITPFDVQHDAAEPLGFFIHSKTSYENLLYFTDTYYLKYTFKDIHYIMAECNHDEESIIESVINGQIPKVLKNRIHKSHMSLETLIETLKANDLSKLKEIYLIHISQDNANRIKIKQKVQEVTGIPTILC